MQYLRATALWAFLCCALGIGAQTLSNAVYQSYIATYKVLAIDQMQRYQIPASITLAQGLLESAAGQSYLAREANNHFGIKVSSDWTGPYLVKADDNPNDRFRRYNSVEESFEDHSRFLHRDRYKALYQLSLYDYKGWARTLKSCGYATSPTYADNLISVIERYNLAEFDHMTLTGPLLGGGYANQGGVYTPAEPQLTNVSTLSAYDLFFVTHPIRRCNGHYYVVAQAGDNLNSVSKATGLRKRRLRKWNEWPRGFEIRMGDIIYLEAKSRRADKSMKGVVHVVQPGESFFDIAQRYGIKVKSIYQINALPDDFRAVPGDRLRVY
ncbi:MAG: glucosaminidase domain-containing protein [Bacteroidaceae bacterium]|nr:glucosaminidase domain-containing protein [Bacteroidaceae bacterium]